jgi:benzoyl-CoA reductase/2-hydroxyglutaryl-CoA dehydratase subunit BcrC/BadD/HgdB
VALVGRERFEQLRAGRIEELTAARAAGRKVVGYFCLYAPVELVAASGAIPVRLQRGGFKAEQAGEKYLRSDACSFCKSCLGNFESDLLYRLCDAVVGISTCDMMRRLPESIERHFGIPAFSLYLPRTAEPLPHRLGEFERQLAWLADELAALTGTELTRERLVEQVAQYDRLRAALREVDARRRQVPPGVSGSEVLDLVALAVLLDPAAAAELIATLKFTPSAAVRPRLALGGSIVTEDDRWLLELVEAKADIVTDFLCTGTRWFTEDVGRGDRETERPRDLAGGLAQLARHYYSRVPCAHRRPNDAFFEFARGRANEFGAQGIVYKTLLYCDPWALERTRLRDELFLQGRSQLGLPLLHIDSTYSVENREQARTRVEAFLENL